MNWTSGNPLLKGGDMARPLIKKDGQWFPITGVARWEQFAPLKTVWVDNQPTDRKVPSTNPVAGGTCPS